MLSKKILLWLSFDDTLAADTELTAATATVTATATATDNAVTACPRPEASGLSLPLSSDVAREFVVESFVRNVLSILVVVWLLFLR